MLEHRTTTASTTDMDIIFSFQSNNVGKLNTVQSFRQNSYSLFPFDFINYRSRRIKNWANPESSGQNTSTALELNFEKEIESATTQELAGTQVQRLAPPFYDEEDVLNWDAVVVPPPPRRSGTIRVKLIYKGRSKPIPDENPWE